MCEREGKSFEKEEGEEIELGKRENRAPAD